VVLLDNQIHIAFWISGHRSQRQRHARRQPPHLMDRFSVVIAFLNPSALCGWMIKSRRCFVRRTPQPHIRVGAALPSLCYFVASFAASFVLSMALSIFSPAFSAGPFSGHALVASATDDRATTMMMFRMIFIPFIMRDFPDERLCDSAGQYFFRRHTARMR